MKLMDDSLEKALVRLIRPFVSKDWLRDDWHEWFAWRPVRVHHYFCEGHFPRGKTVGWVWLETVWRRFKGSDRIPYYVIKRYPNGDDSGSKPPPFTSRCRT